MKTLFLIFLIGFVLIAGGLGLLDIVFSIIGGALGLVAGLFSLVIGIIGGAIGLVVGALAVIFTVLLPLLIVAVLIGGILKLVF